MSSENGVSLEEENKQLKELIISLDQKTKINKFQLQKTFETLTRLEILITEINKLLDLVKP